MVLSRRQRVWISDLEETTASCLDLCFTERLYLPDPRFFSGKPRAGVVPGSRADVVATPVLR